MINLIDEDIQKSLESLSILKSVFEICSNKAPQKDILSESQSNIANLENDLILAKSKTLLLDCESDHKRDQIDFLELEESRLNRKSNNLYFKIYEKMKR